MAQLSLRERLQPALLDRLIDDERLLTCYDFEFSRDGLTRLGVSERELTATLASQGLRTDEAVDSVSSAGALRLTLFAPGGMIRLSQLKALLVRGTALQSLGTVTVRNVVNTSAESVEHRTISMRRLRDYVCRDLSALLNCANLDAVENLEPYPHIQSSVVNFGMPSLSGRAARAADPLRIAMAIELAIQRFEPRLSQVHVTPEMGEEGNETHVLAFRIDAQLWGQVAPQQLVLRTSIDVDSGSVSLADGVG
jgi:type VI secretion system protein ImpF